MGYQGIPNSIALTFDLRDAAGEGDDSTGIYVDGSAIQGDGPNVVGLDGGGLGYQGLAKSLAVKFDLKNTASEGVDSTGNRQTARKLTATVVLIPHKNPLRTP